MEWTGLNDLRKKFLEFFESKEHLRLPSFSLIPRGTTACCSSTPAWRP